MEIIECNDNTKANKDHKCSFCNGLIKKGELYESSTCKNDGDLYTWKSHKHCSTLTSWIDFDFDYDGITQEMFYEVIRDEFNERFTIGEMAVLLFEKIRAEKEGEQ